MAAYRLIKKYSNGGIILRIQEIAQNVILRLLFYGFSDQFKYLLQNRYQLDSA